MSHNLTWSCRSISVARRACTLAPTERNPTVTDVGLPPLILQPGVGPLPAATYLPATPDTVLWGRLPAAGDSAVLTVAPGSDVTIDTISHEGLLEDQGRDPEAFFAQYGVDEVLA